jgi:hypothetical protein
MKKGSCPRPPWLLFLHPTTLHSKIILNVGDYGFLALTNRYHREQLFKTFCHPTFYPVFLPPLFQVFLEAESVVVAEPEVVVSAVAASGPEVVSAVAVV